MKVTIELTDGSWFISIHRRDGARWRLYDTHTCDTFWQAVTWVQGMSTKIERLLT